MIEVENGQTPTGRRSYTMAFKLEVLRQWDASIEYGSKRRLLRENNLHQSTIYKWLAARERGEFTTEMVKTADRTRTRMDSRDRAELAKLRRENERLKRKVEQAEAAQEILGKAFELLQGINKTSTDASEIPPALMSADEYARWLNDNRLS